MAGLEEVPALIRPLSDTDAKLLQIVENLQREDVHPLEEALAYRNLIDDGMAVEQIAARVGKRPPFVAQRLMLTSLHETVSAAFLEDRIPLGHALLIAKLKSEQQEEALKASTREVWSSDGYRQIVIPLKELQGWIEENILLRLDEAAFDKADPELLPDAGSCLDCPKRTGHNLLLFEEIREDSCADRPCFAAKLDRHIAAALAAKPKLMQISASWGSKAANGVIARTNYVEIVRPPKGRKKADNPEWQRCPHAKEAIITEGQGRGFNRLVCAESTCEIHHAPKRVMDDAACERRDSLRDEAKRRKQELTERIKLLDSILAKVTAPLTRDNLEVVAVTVLDKLGHESRVRLAKRWKLDIKAGSHSGEYLALMLPQIQCENEKELCRTLMEMALVDLASNVFYTDGKTKLEEVLNRQADK